MPWRGPRHPDDFPSLGWALLEWQGRRLDRKRAEREAKGQNGE